MLPTYEIDTLTMIVTDAIDLAADGQVADGYAALVWGLHRAEEMVDAELPWAQELADRWRLAVENYCTTSSRPSKARGAKSRGNWGLLFLSILTVTVSSLLTREQGVLCLSRCIVLG